MKIQFLRNVDVDRLTKFGDLDPKYIYKFAEFEVDSITEPLNKEVVIYLSDGSTFLDVPLDSFSILTTSKKPLELIP